MQKNRHPFLISLFKGDLSLRAISSDLYSKKTPEPLASAVDGARDTAFVVLFSVLLIPFSMKVFFAFLFSWSLFLGIQKTYGGWKLLKRLHQIISAEKWEIEHHRKQERKELETMYKAKGFEGKLLNEVVDVLMADTNRLLQVMLEEEMGIELESYTHPLALGFGACMGSLISGILLGLGFLFFSIKGIFLAVFLIIFIYSIISSRFEKRGFLNVLMWNSSIALFLSFTSYFLSKL